MAKLSYPDFFNDVFGPIMQPGSSGGFAGPVRLGNAARALAGGAPLAASVLVPPDYGDLSQLDTFMSDRGYIGGLLGFDTADARLFEARTHAQQAGVRVSFGYGKVADAIDADAVLIEVRNAKGVAHSLMGASVGGGMIAIRSIDGFPLEWAADTHLMLATGNKAEMEALARALEAHAGPTLLASSIHAKEGEGPDPSALLALELSEAPTASLHELAAPFELATLPALLPVTSHAQRKPQLFRTIAEWEQVAADRGLSLAEAAILYEQAFSGWSAERIWERLSLIKETLDGQIRAVEHAGGPFAVAETPVLPVYARQWASYASPLSDGLSGRIIAYALAVNAKVPGTPIVPGPMGTGGGYLFSALRAVQEHYELSEERLLESLAIAAALGALAYTHTNASGERGCVGESGVCCAMAAGAIAYLAGGGARQVEAAASMALQASFGITCDPIPGGREFPCITRTVRAATTAPLYADLALAGIDAIIPYHEVLQAVEKHYRRTPSQMLCGSRCGCNLTRAAQDCQRWLAETAAINNERSV